jgi:hypothetical protein
MREGVHTILVQRRGPVATARTSIVGELYAFIENRFGLFDNVIEIVCGLLAGFVYNGDDLLHELQESFPALLAFSILVLFVFTSELLDLTPEGRDAFLVVHIARSRPTVVDDGERREKAG